MYSNVRKKKQQHDLHAKSREFQVGEGVYVTLQSEGDLDSSRGV